jgi:1-deoxy-D-xylulose-5-phosphate reductoisomerase
MLKKVALLGSTGSIGESTLQIARHLKEKIVIKAIAAHSNIDKLESQAREFHPELIAVYDENQAAILQKRLPGIPVVSGLEGLNAVAGYGGANFVVSAISGTMGLIPTLAAINAGHDVGLANKEALVSGGALVMKSAQQEGVKILPIDSEHSAIFQCLEGEKKSAISRLILTASGGPFRTYSSEQLQSVTKEMALCHPTWQMGAKVTIDSSTLMNKGLEVIEAHFLFGVPIQQIDVLIHPQSIIHSMVEFVDNSTLAQLGKSTMITPIQYALTYPERLPGLLEPFNFLKHPVLEFFKPDTDKFRCLKLAFEAIAVGGTLPCYMNAANEVLVHRFLDKKISWNEIAVKLETLMQKHVPLPVNEIGDVLEADRLAREDAKSI